MAPIMNLNESEPKERMSALLHSTDEYLKKGKLDEALETVRSVYRYDKNNMYARAFEERILAMTAERNGKQIPGIIEDQIIPPVEDNGTPKGNGPGKGDDDKRRESQEKKGNELELKAREAAIIERQTEYENTYQKLLHENRENTETIQQTQSSKELQSSHEILVDKMKIEYTKQINEIQKRSDDNEKEILSRAAVKYKSRSIEAYKSILLALDDHQIESKGLLHSLRTILDVSDEESQKLLRSVKLQTYITALRKAWEDGRIEEDEQLIINNLRFHYEISDEENDSLVKQVKIDLGIPDNDAMILVIDDNPDILLFCDYALRKTYNNVKTAESAAAALDIIAKQMPSLIVCDIMMPEVSGFQFRDNIINGSYGEEIKSIPFMFISACDDDYMKNIASKQGISKYLAKPISKETLESAVIEMLMKKDPTIWANA